MRDDLTDVLAITNHWLTVIRVVACAQGLKLSLYLLQIKTSAVLWHLEDNAEGEITALALSADGNFIAMASEEPDLAISVWCVEKV